MQELGRFIVRLAGVILLYWTAPTVQQNPNDDNDDLNLGLPPPLRPLPEPKSARWSSQSVNVDRLRFLGEASSCAEKEAICSTHLITMENELKPPEKSTSGSWPSLWSVRSAETNFRDCCENTEVYIRRLFPGKFLDFLLPPKMTVEDLEKVDPNNLREQKRMRELFESQHCLARYTRSAKLECLSQTRFFDEQNRVHLDPTKPKTLDDLGQTLLILEPYCKALQKGCNRKTKALDSLSRGVETGFEWFKNCCEIETRSFMRGLTPVRGGACKAGERQVTLTSSWLDNMRWAVGQPRTLTKFTCKPTDMGIE